MFFPIGAEPLESSAMFLRFLMLEGFFRDIGRALKLICWQRVRSVAAQPLFVTPQASSR